MFTSRAEHRLLLRQDNADRRLMALGYENELVGEELYLNTLKKYNDIDECIKYFKRKQISIDERIKNILGERGKEINITGSISVDKLLKRPGIRITDILEIISEKIDERIISIVEMEIKYEGYIKKDMEWIRKYEKMDSRIIPDEIDYNNIIGLKNEAREKLKKIKPRTLGQAMRISGVDPSDISIIIVYLEAAKRNVIR
jgi:tRNA uridine 5-carboxymethylaminomethyl modification enzyme